MELQGHLVSPALTFGAALQQTGLIQHQPHRLRKSHANAAPEELKGIQGKILVTDRTGYCRFAYLTQPQQLGHKSLNSRQRVGKINVGFEANSESCASLVWVSVEIC